jgi:hypothetical protein
MWCVSHICLAKTGLPVVEERYAFLKSELECIFALPTVQKVQPVLGIVSCKDIVNYFYIRFSCVIFTSQKFAPFPARKKYLPILAGIGDILSF